MWTCALLVTAALASPLVQDDPDDRDEKRLARAVEALDEAFSKGDAADRIAALNGAAGLAHEDVVAAAKRGLRDREPTVVSATIELFRYLEHDDALDALHAAEKRNKKITKDDELHPRLLKAIAQHGRHESLALLADDFFSHRAYAVIQARIRGIGNIRHEDSVVELIGLMNKGSRKNVNPYMGEFRLALMVLTGRDEGKSVEGWMRWWNDNKKTLVVRPEPPKLPREFQERWDNYWGIRRIQERGTKRGDRGSR